MNSSPTRLGEQARLNELRLLGLLDSGSEDRFDRFTRLAQRLFGSEMAAISLIDTNRQWFKSAQGIDEREMPRQGAPCNHTVALNSSFHLRDASADSRFSGHPLISSTTQVRFYAGAPIHGPAGYPVGTISVMDRAPQTFSDDDRAALEDLAAIITGELKSQALVTTDPLTGICNRRGFDTLSAQTLAFCARRAAPSSVLVIDLDLFKAINDEWGHAEGDAALHDFAQVLRKTFRESDVVGRTGGDEFAVLLAGTGARQGQMGNERLLSAVRTYNQGSAKPWSLRCSVGLAELEGYDNAALVAAMRRADEQMYAHKRVRRLRRMAV